MRITADTNLLVRAVMADEPVQTRLTEETLAHAELVALTLPALCELVWVLRYGYRVPRERIALALRRLIEGDNIEVDLAAADAGIAQLEAGGDFADAVIAHEGRALGGDTFVSFDRRAVALISARGARARLLA